MSVEKKVTIKDVHNMDQRIAHRFDDETVQQAIEIETSRFHADRRRAPQDARDVHEVARATCSSLWRSVPG